MCGSNALRPSTSRPLYGSAPACDCAARTLNCSDVGECKINTIGSSAQSNVSPVNAGYAPWPGHPRPEQTNKAFPHMTHNQTLINSLSFHPLIRVSQHCLTVSD